MFFRRTRTVTVTNDAFARWLRAQRPPLDWFLGLAELEQEQLAMLGDQHLADAAIAFAHAVRDPELSAAGMAAARGDEDGEAVLARRLAEGVAAAMTQRQGPAPRGETMAGIGARRNLNQGRRARRLFGGETA